MSRCWITGRIQRVTKMVLLLLAPQLALAQWTEGQQGAAGYSRRLVV